MARLPKPRERAIHRMTGLLLRRGSPRVQMMLFLSATGLAGFLCSVLLHAVGLRSMAIRYPLCVGVAYLVFLILLYLFVAYHRSRLHLDATGLAEEVAYGVDDAELLLPLSNPPTLPASTSPAPSSSPASGKGSSGGRFDLGDGDGEGLVVVVVVILIIIAIAAAVFASVVVLIEAPILLAEVLVDGVLLAGLARRIRSRRAHWTTGVIRRTWVPLLFVAVCFGAVGLALDCLVPGATTMGEAVRMARGQ